MASQLRLSGWGAVRAASAVGAGLGWCSRDTAAEASTDPTGAPQDRLEGLSPLSCRDEVAHTWGDLMRLIEQDTHVPSLGSYRSQMLYRGASSGSWEPLTSLQRLNHSPSEVSHIESAILRAFRSYASEALSENSSPLLWLALAQHHGAPTRLLDFSHSPLTAIYFATEDESMESEPGVIWCIHPRNCFHASPEYKSAHERWKGATGNSFYHVARISQLDALTTSAWGARDSQEDGLFKRLASLGDSLAL